jgi:hypothetical protein
MGPLAKFRIDTTSFLMSVRYAWNILTPIKRIFMKFDIRNFFRKSVVKIQVSLKSDKNNGYLHINTYVIRDDFCLSSS